LAFSKRFQSRDLVRQSVGADCHLQHTNRHFCKRASDSLMPATITQSPIPMPTPDNLLQVVSAIRQALIAMSNTGAGRSDITGKVLAAPSQFVLQNEVILPVTYTIN